VLGCGDTQITDGPDVDNAEVAVFTTHIAREVESLRAFVAAGVPVDAFVEIDPGFGRFGFLASQWAEAFAVLAQQSTVRLKGVYTHLSSPGDEAITARQAGVFDAALADAHSAGFRDLETLGRVLVGGREATIMGRRSLQHTVIDLSALPEAGVGSVVTFVGEDGGGFIGIDELADAVRIPVMELLPRVVRMLPQISRT
jgi:alanine racemase